MGRTTRNRAAVLFGAALCGVAVGWVILRESSTIRPTDRIAQAQEEEFAFGSSSFRLRLAALDAEDWRHRQIAARELVETHTNWAPSVPAGWQPRGAERRWRWRWVLDRAEELRRLPILLAEPFPTQLEWKLRRLYQEVPRAVLDRLAAYARSHADPRVRRRSLRWKFRLDPPKRGANSGRAALLAQVASDVDPSVRRAVYSIAAEVDRGWLTTEIRRVLVTLPSNPRIVSSDPRAEAVRAVREEKLTELRALLLDLWDEAVPTLRLEIARSLANDPHPADHEVFLWALEYGDYRGLIDAIRALERILPAASERVRDRAVRRMLQTPAALEHAPVASRLLAFVRRSGDSRYALDLLPYLEATEGSVREATAQLLVSWEATDFFTDVVCTLGPSALIKGK